MKPLSKPLVPFLAGLSLVLSGCASTTISRNTLTSVGPAQIARHKTPDLKEKTLGGAIVEAIGGGAILPTFVIAPAIDSHATKRDTANATLPDPGDLIVKRFRDLAQITIPDWPAMTEIANPVDKEYKPGGAPLVLLNIEAVWLHFVQGLVIIGDLSMFDTRGTRLFKKKFVYTSRKAGRRRPVKEYIADNCKLLAEEMPLAADYTVRELLLAPLKEGL